MGFINYHFYFSCQCASSQSNWWRNSSIPSSHMSTICKKIKWTWLSSICCWWRVSNYLVSQSTIIRPIKTSRDKKIKEENQWENCCGYNLKNREFVINKILTFIINNDGYICVYFSLLQYWSVKKLVSGIRRELFIEIWVPWRTTG